MPNRTRSSSGDRKVVAIAEAARRRRVKNLRDLADAMEGAADASFDGQFTMLGNMNLLEGSFDEAIEAFSRAMSLAPDDVSALAGRGQAYRAIGEHALALADFDRAVALAPGEARHHLGRSNSLAALRRMRRSGGGVHARHRDRARTTPAPTTHAPSTGATSRKTTPG